MSDADEGTRIEIEDLSTPVQDVRHACLIRLLGLGTELAEHGEELVRVGEKTKRFALSELREYCAEDCDAG